MSPNLYLTVAERTLLESACVGIAGAGGLGSNCAALLVRAGVKRLVIADFDTVGESNLNRQFFFLDQVGMKKVDALARNLRRINPEVALELHNVRLDAESAVRIFSPCTHVVEALDGAAEKVMLYSALSSKPMAGASGIAGWGRSSAIGTRRIGGNLVLAGDMESAVSPDCAPQSARVAIAAAIEANTILAMILGKDI
ncbi:MAG: sulfur carrier protein ThiS adenylyltransferase ThiF [Kiritimatiellae bacterium]|nr:sulfur carrier protein ThiS adenylyltransferase ThiF [Kiritimatiellia bacterium]